MPRDAQVEELVIQANAERKEPMKLALSGLVIGTVGHRPDKQEGEKKPRDRGKAWSEDEHKLFLIGLDKYGKGDWRSISRNCVLSRTPAQVASHAQKYFIRQEAEIDDQKFANRRVSIHDISSLEMSMLMRSSGVREKEPGSSAIFRFSLGV